MGGGDLNLKKSWHPGTFRNQEKVWKQERKAEEEEKKLQQLRKELEEEKQIQELQRLQDKSGGRKHRNEGLSWMYAAAPSSGARDEKDQEDYLLGKKRVDELLNKKDDTKALSRDSDFLLGSSSKANSARDIQAKIREDPLLAIKRREQASMEALMKNPIRLRKMREKQEQERQASGSKSHTGKEKKEKKEKKRKRSHRDEEEDNKEREKERKRRRERESGD